MAEDPPTQEARKGFSFYMASFFIVAQMAGAGFLSLPASIANTGWLGVPMMVLFSVMVGFAATRLGYCWDILEERWPEQYSEPSRQPYVEMAYRSYGKHGRNIAFLCVMVAQFGGTTVYIILIAQMLHTLVPQLSTCEWVLILAAVITPGTWLGTPNDFKFGPMLAVVSTIVACLVVFVQILLDASDQHYTQYSNPTVTSFALGFGTIIFAFGGSSVFPTIQNDMQDKSQFWKSIVTGFSCILAMYLPVSISAYWVFGHDVDSNILFAVSQGWPTKMAIGLQVVNLTCSYLIGFNVVTQSVEEVCSLPTTFGWKRVVSRTVIVGLEVIICLAIPDFSLILNLIGGSSITVCTFILPPLMYMRLASSGPAKTQREIPLWMKITLIEIVIIGTIGGTLSTASAAYAIATTPFSDSCFVKFT